MGFQIYKIHSDFYYLEDENNNKRVCKIREILKKQKNEIVVGDFVELSKDETFITSVLKRNNFILRPKCANVDLAIVVSSIKEPEFNFNQLNRYLTFLKYNNINTIICFNKVDLLKSDFNAQKIYKKLGYKTFLTSAKTKQGLDELKKYIKNKTVVLAGMSGVGKSTLLNAITNINAKTGEISHKTQKGCHTTRHLEITKYKDFKIMDTPGFSNLKFDFILPDRLIDLFDDLKEYKNECKFSNCLHNNLEDKTCGVTKNIEKIDKSRYESYVLFLNEALEYKEKISQSSIKEEKTLKNSGNKILTKISKKKREFSRKTLKQKIDKE